MSAKFLESFGSKLAEQWLANLLTPAFVFWAGGAAAGLQHFGWKRPSLGSANSLNHYKSPSWSGFCA
ncbi:hypothetical protein LC653_23705 [Nostoc sp. CHAB 5784]|uniref:hypothetical protein n=1 Tax=Nostoc mirabile TaxID=2907820 RepID=UPI001E64CE27|nr:hypothetical protein [Nostoc mirabile]MCC5666814.1 hypothetical protein [Nostoc mirabile CHAB5784]